MSQGDGQRSRPDVRTAFRGGQWLWLAAAAVVGVLIFLAMEKGPFWLGPNLDPDYPYLFNGLLVARGEAVEHVDHPGTPVQLLLGLLLRACNLTASSESLVQEVLLRPEWYLDMARWLMLALVGATLVAVGRWTARATASVGAGVLVVVSPLLTPTVLREVSCVKPEPVLLMTGLGLGALALVSAARAREARPGWKLAGGMGLLTAVAVTSKVTALPLLAVPVLVLRGWRERGIWAGTAMAAGGLILIPAYGRLWKLWSLAHAIATTTGRYGNPSWPAASPAGNGAALVLRLSEAPLMVLAGALCGAAAWRTRGRGSGGRWGSAGGASGAFCVALVLQAALEWTHPYESRYLLPGLALVGPALVAAGWALRPHVSRAWSTASARQMLALGTGLLAVISVWWVYTEFADQRAALAAQDKLLQGYPTTPVLDFYRASTPQFALFFGNGVAGNRFGRELDAQDPDRIFFNVLQGGFSGYRSILSTPYALTSHDVILRGSTPDVWPPLVRDPMFQQRLLPADGSPTLDGLYRVEIAPSVQLRFGDFLAEGLQRPTVIQASANTLVGRKVHGRAVLRFTADDAVARMLVGEVMSAGAQGATVQVLAEGREVGVVRVPGGMVPSPVSVPIPAAPAGVKTREVTLRVDEGEGEVIFTALWLKAGQ